YSLLSPKYKTSSPKTKIEFISDFSPDLPQIVADPDQLQQVFLNLILNAVDSIYTVSDRQGIITIKTQQLPGDELIQVSISDNGKGIDSTALEEVFKPFFTTKSHGTGLGLAICKRLVEQHDGSISVENNTKGEGVTFTLTFPVG
ncbi:MAG: GHKL domain-containing protein, partial [Gammaproteobacteria bacterium]|nr:GHKL domain-containing protein [Gammaproteobacteria bacterium]NIT53391.1 GHKL domain-containing protein [candidate division Zixibacteria bacterium]NIW47193.1 GHKL domain-containing protein [Gammaproteobacteria bacterium]